MLILAGVSINAIVGDNGVLTKTTYASFLSEMSAVEEAVQMWKAGEIIEAKGDEVKAIPANGLCRANDLTSAERLVGEVGFYRVWSLTSTMPTTDILSSADTFNSSFESELVFYPAGVQDLYYLNNDALDIKGNKTYLIDATTGMIYSMTGISLKGVRCYSLNMAKAVMNGSIEQPLFAEAEVSGTGSGEKLAGNVSTEYLMDENGNYILDESGNKIKNPDYNPNGFQIIASSSSNNIFKLYNDGTLYGKGVKGIQLNTNESEMDAINSHIWKEWNVPSEIKNVKKIIMGSNGSMYFIDSNDDLWVYGSNSHNKFGLTTEQQVEFTGREAFKVNIENKKVKKVFPGNVSTFVITTDDLLYAAGYNVYGQLGLGDTHTTIEFEQVDMPNPENIKQIYNRDAQTRQTIIRYNDNTFYFAGSNSWSGLGDSKTNRYLKFTKIWDGIVGPDIDQDIKEITLDCQNLILLNNGTLLVGGFGGYMQGDKLVSSGYGTYKQYTNVDNIIDLYQMSYAGAVFTVKNEEQTELWAIPANTNNCGSDYLNYTYPVKLELPENLEKEGIKEVYVTSNNLFILSNIGKLYGAGYKPYLGINETTGYTTGIQYLNINNISTLYDSTMQFNKKMNSVPIFLKNGKYYMTASATLMFGNDILQKSWIEVAKNVKYFDAKSTCYVDTDGYLWVAGDSRMCGLGELSEAYTEIKNYIKCTDPNIAGKVKSCYVQNLVTYVLLTDKTLWATGLYSNNGNDYKPGWEEVENQTVFVKLLNDIEFFTATEECRVAIDTEGYAYSWGRAINGAGGSQAAYNSSVPYKYDLPSEIGGVENILNIVSSGWQRTHLITKTGNLFITGNWNNGAFDGGVYTKNYFSQYTHNITLNEGEKIISAVKMNDSNCMILTDNGRIFGWGNENCMGIGSTLSSQTETRLISEINNVSQLVCGNGWYVVVKNDGTVWGTGTNTYGILGRWIGVDRNTPNSRYKTAFEWVECPELEI